MDELKPIVRHVTEVEPVPCPCGQSTRIITRADGAAVGLHVTELSGARKHYHEHTTEVYYVLEGEGQIELGEDVFDVRAGHAVYIPAGVPHRTIGVLKAIVVSAPAFDPNDEHLCD